MKSQHDTHPYPNPEAVSAHQLLPDVVSSTAQQVSRLRSDKDDRLDGNNVSWPEVLQLVGFLKQRIGALKPVYQVQALNWSKQVEEAHLRRKKGVSNLDLEKIETAFLLHELKRICLQGDAPQILAQAKLDFLSFNFLRPLQENVVPKEAWHPVAPVKKLNAQWSLLGRVLSSPFGIPACVLTANSAWIEFHARRNFNVLTFKTVRSRYHRAHEHPNWVILEGMDAPSPVGEFPHEVRGDLLTWPGQPKSFSSANSFGISSLAPEGGEGWQQQVAQALRSMRDDQLLLVSVVGNHEVCAGEELTQDFVEVSRLAEQAGAPVIELNLSCPNTVDRATGQVDGRALCENTADSIEITRRVRAALHSSTKLVIKLPFMSKPQLEKLVVPLAGEGSMDGVSGINTIPAQVRRSDGSPTFIGTFLDPEMPRLNAGVSGVAVRDHGLQFVRWLNELRGQHKLSFDIIAMGGVMNCHDVTAYLEAGASAVQSATAAAFSPEMGSEVASQLVSTRPVDSRP